VVRGAVALSGRLTAERESVLARVAAVEQLCAQYRIPIAAVSLQFALAHPAVASVLLGASTLSEQARNFDAAGTDIPDGLRVTLRKGGHLRDDAPTLPATREARA
jgi:D-threo-aldose 1-dehydrogenase